MLLTAPGKTSQTPTVPTVSMAPVDLAAASSARISSAAAASASLRPGISLPPAWPPSPSISDAQAGRRGNVRHQADIDSFLLQKRALLDVQLDKLMEASSGNGDRFKRASESGAARATLPGRGLPCRASASACAGESTPAIMRLPRQPMPKRVGSSAVKMTSSIERRGLKPKLLQNANRFKAAQHAHAAVIEPGVGNRVDVRAGADGRKLRLAALPARKGVADRVFAHRRARPPRTGLSRKRARAGPLR